MKSEGIGFREAHERLALMSHAPAVEVEKPAPAASAADLIWLERATTHYHRRLLETPAAQDYLRSRGITSPEIVTAFRLGYADGTLLQHRERLSRKNLKRGNRSETVPIKNLSESLKPRSK
jgi:DNA primase